LATESIISVELGIRHPSEEELVMNLVSVGMRRMMLTAWVASSLLATGPAAWGQETQEMQEPAESAEPEETPEPEESAAADRAFAETITVTVQ
jgi:hypothetical protein